MARVQFENISRPKIAAKKIARVARCALSSAQGAVARCSGYRDWHDLETSIQKPTSLGRPVIPVFNVQDWICISELLANDLDLTSGDALYALGISRLMEPHKTTIREQLDILPKLFRLRELPVGGRRQRGAIGIRKVPGRNNETVILKRFGKPTHIITHQSGRASAADFEYVTPRGIPELFIPMRLYLAYGIWTELDGSKILFSRDYCPMWRLRSGRMPERMLPWERVSFVKQEFFWGDHEQVLLPWHDHAMHKAGIDRLESYGIRYLPKLVEILPLVVSRDDLDFIDAVKELGRIHALSPAA